MNYLRMLTIPVLLGLLAVFLGACPREADQTDISIQDESGVPGTTIVETEETPPSETNIDVDVDMADTDEPVVVSETVRTDYPEVVAVLEQQVTVPTETSTVYIADAPAIQVWTTEIVPAEAPADVYYYVRDFEVTNVTDTELVADAHILVGSTSPDFVAQRKYVTYTFQRNPDTNQWLIYDLDVSRTEEVPADESGADMGTNEPGAAGDSGNSGSGDAGGL